MCLYFAISRLQHRIGRLIDVISRLSQRISRLGCIIGRLTVFFSRLGVKMNKNPVSCRVEPFDFEIYTIDVVRKG